MLICLVSVILILVGYKASLKTIDRIAHLHDLRHNIVYILWFIVLYFIWDSLIDEPICTPTNCSLWFVKNLLLSALILAISLFFEALLVQYITVEFHKTAYQSRIIASRRADLSMFSFSIYFIFYFLLIYRKSDVEDLFSCVINEKQDVKILNDSLSFS